MYRLLLLILLINFSTNKVFADLCPSTSDWNYQKGSSWSLPQIITKDWAIEESNPNGQATTAPIDTVVKLEVWCGLFSCSDVACKYYKSSDLSTPLIILHNVNNSSVRWDSIKNYDYITYDTSWSNAISCQTLATNTAICSWQFD